ncbi:hypothetical protein Tsp_11735 [Trichinella spiralis]|uniref:hypothetical protein n=1 Tax=Trichinella spiralis TaxID=6334 RepID=UPI0001EFE6EF|nr:hypothetical protein Tsp_11735 [Trichinella spiralis]
MLWDWASRKKLYDEDSEECWAVRQFLGGESFFCYRAKDNRSTYRMCLADFGASHHITRNRECFVDFVTFPKPLNVKVRNDNAIPAYGRGTVNFKVFINLHPGTCLHM